MTVAFFLPLELKHSSISQVPYTPSSFVPEVILPSKLHCLALPFILLAACPFLTTSQSYIIFCFMLITGLHLSSDIWVVCVNLLRSIGAENLEYFGGSREEKEEGKTEKIGTKEKILTGVY